MEQAGASPPGRHRPRPVVALARPRLLVAATVVLVAFGLVVGMLLAPAKRPPEPAAQRATPTATATATPSPTATPTPPRAASPTVHARPPLAGPSAAPTGSVAPSSAGATTDGGDAALVADRTAAIRAVLADYAQAMLHRDRPAFAATLDSSAKAFAGSQLAMFANAASVPFQSYAFDVDPADVASAAEIGTSRLLVAVDLRYALRGFDSEPTDLRKYLTFTVRPDGWLLAGDQDGAGRGEQSATDLWDYGPVVVVHGARSMVLAHPAGRALARTLAATADAAVPKVTAFWGTGWARKVVILVPDSEHELAAVVGTTEDLSQIAALATAEISSNGSGQSAVGDRIAINPSTFGELGALGRQVVVAHEITHVATRAVTDANSPTWLVEGIADYVGFKDTPTSTRFDAAELAREVDAGDLPQTLPTSKDFADAGSDLSVDYEEAWLACRFIVARTDEATLKAFYRQVGTDTGSPSQVLSDAFADVLHTDQGTFTRSWQHYVETSLE